MNRFTRRVFFGMIIWAVPFTISTLLWDPKIGGPRIGHDWFNSLMTLSLAAGFAIAAVLHFRSVKTKTVEEGWKTGATWFAQLAALDFLVLVNLFSLDVTRYFQILASYLAVAVLAAAMGWVKKGD